MPGKMPLGDVFDVVTGLSPVDLESGAHSADIISLKNASGVAILVSLAAPGGGADDVTIHLNQCSAVAGTGRKDLAVTTEYYSKFGTQTATGSWTRVTQAASADVVLTGSGAAAAMAVIYVDTSKLDVDGGFDCLEVTIADAGAGGAIYGSILYVPVGIAYKARPDKLPNSIVD